MCGRFHLTTLYNGNKAFGPLISLADTPATLMERATPLWDHRSAKIKNKVSLYLFIYFEFWQSCDSIHLHLHTANLRVLIHAAAATSPCRDTLGRPAM